MPFWVELAGGSNFEAILKPFRLDFGPPEPRKSRFSCRGCAFFEKSQISKESLKSSLRGAPGPPKRRPKSIPGRPLIGVIGLPNRIWAPPGAFNELFLAPGPLPRAIWSAPGAHFWPTWGPRAPQRAPRAHFRPSGGSPGTVFDLFFKGFWGAILMRCGCCFCPSAFASVSSRMSFFQSVNRKICNRATLNP